MTYKLIALDMDDTLLTTQKSISDQNKIAIKKAINQGIKIVLCSGRTHNAVMEYANYLDIKGSDQYIITNGGAIIEDMEGKIVFQKMMSNEFYREFVQFVHENKLQYNVVDNLGRTFTSNREWIDKYTIMQAYENANGLYFKEPVDLPSNFQIAKAIINGNKEKLDGISEMVHERFDKDYFVVRTGVGFLEIFPKDVNKGQALIKLTNILNIDLKDCMAMGDRDNDIPMLKIVGKGIAMDNAMPDVKDVSDFVTADNNHSGVGMAIEKFALN